MATEGGAHRDSIASGAPTVRPAAALHDHDESARWLGIELTDHGSGCAVVTMTVRPEMCNGHGTCHGGLIFTLADAAFAFACNSAGEPTVAAAASIDFLRAVPAGSTLRATATERWRGGRAGLYDVVVDLPDGTPVALFRGRSQQIGSVQRAGAGSDATVEGNPR